MPSAYPPRPKTAAALYVDTHCHVDAYFRPSEAMEAARQSGVQVVAVTNLPSHRERLMRRLGQNEIVSVALGVHPGEAPRMDVAEWRRFEAQVATADNIGEIGLDFSAGADRLTQERVFVRLLGMIVDRPRLVTVHSRRAVRPLLRHLAAAHANPVVFHWFSGSLSDLEAILSAGHLVSINTAMITSQRWHSLIHTVPQNRVLAETDGPFAKLRGRPAWPSDVVSVYAWLADRWGGDIAFVRQRLADTLTATRNGEEHRGPATLFDALR